MYAIVDIETTGGYAGKHRITEIAIVHYDGVGVTGQYHTLINPERKIPAFITGLTGITNEMVKQAPTFDEVAPEIFTWLEDRVFVAHNVTFDFSFLHEELEQVGIQWGPKKLCTVRLARKIIPGLASYSLGRLAERLNINVTNRHRAAGDAQATVTIFDLLLKNDTEGIIAKTLKRNVKETILPPNLEKETLEKLPTETGVYYFLNAQAKVIYVGKALNIKKRIISHFTGEAREWSRSNIRNEIHQITYELTGNEFIALILESQEIRRLWPKYNLAQKNKSDDWGVYLYEDRNGYLRFAINIVSKGSKPLITFASKGDAWNFMWEKVKEFDLCPKLSGLQLAKGLCFSHQTGVCKGACQGMETTKKYNKRAQKTSYTFSEGEESMVIIGQGRKVDEKSIVLIEKGNYIGFGFVPKDKDIQSLEESKNYIKQGKDNRAVKNLIQVYLLNPKGAEQIVIF